MKLCNRILSAVLVVLLLASAVPAVNAKGNSKNGTPGSTVTLTFTYSNIYGVSGDFSVSDPNGIIDSWSVGYSGLTGNVSKTNVFLFHTGSPSNVTISAVIKLKAGAQPGQTASIKLVGSVDKDAMGENPDAINDTATVTVIQKTVVVEPTPTPTPEVVIDYTGLERQIALANGLNENDYTADTWQALLDALAAANDALNKKDQTVVNNAAKALEDAINALVRMDYSALEAVLKQVQAFLDQEETSELWVQLSSAVARANELLTSGDQEAVNAVTAEINELLPQLQALIQENSVPEVVIQEVQVEVPPTEDFCNIPMHRIWPVLFFISLGVNVLLGGAVILVLSAKKKKQDDTPLVDYDIDDDFEDA